VEDFCTGGKLIGGIEYGIHVSQVLPATFLAFPAS
jgi:hypothetical protein